MQKNSKNIWNSGSAVVEAALVLPLFIFMIVTMYTAFQCKLAELYVYEAASETAGYVAQFSYLHEGNILIPQMRFAGYVDDKEIVERSIQSGLEGVSFLESNFLTQDNMVELCTSYKLRCISPFALENPKRKFVVIRRAFVGDVESENDKNNQQKEAQYVYITDNQEVYHESRSCTYLMLEVNATTKEIAMEHGFAPCGFCGDDAVKFVYITTQGEHFHSRSNCTGLKRSVKRVRKKDVAGLPACSRCAKSCK